MLELPPDITIGYRKYTFIPFKPDTDPTDNHLGFHNGSFGEIEIDLFNDPPYPHQELLNVIFHEILHGICSMYHADLDEAAEEHIVNVIGDGLTQVFIDNPQFIDWMRQHCQRDTNGKALRAP